MHKGANFSFLVIIFNNLLILLFKQIYGYEKGGLVINYRGAVIGVNYL